MVNKHLFKANLKSNYGIIIFILGMLIMYTSIAIGMYDPSSAEGLAGMMDLMPEAMVKAFGFDGLGTEMTSYLSNYLFGFIYLTFPVIFIVVVANNLMVKHVESGSMTYLLTTPNTRRVIARSQAVFLGTSLTFIMGINLLLAVVMAEIMFPSKLDIVAYSSLNLATLGCLYMVSSMAFFVSATFNDSKKALSISAGIPILFIVLKMLAAVGESVAFLKYFSLFSLVDVSKILDKPLDGIFIFFVTLLGGSLVYYVAVLAFDRRSLSI